MDAEIRGRDLLLIERTIEKIDSIVSNKIILDNNGQIEEIHIVSDGSRNAKQVSRDIQSVLIATYGMNIDYKKISIAAIPEISLGKREARMKLEKVSHEQVGNKALVKVVLSNHMGSFEDCLEGPNTARSVDRMLAQVTLKCIERAYNYNDMFVADDVSTVQLSSDKIVFAIVACLFNGQEKRVTGSCLVRNNYDEAIVKATLDAINRYLAK